MLAWLAGLAGAALLLMRPAAAAAAARDALAQWYATVAPSLFPFMALLPLLTSEESLHIYGALLGGAMRRMFRLPGATAAALAVGMLAGSPAGCLAARRAAAATPLRRGELERLAAACCGLSPGFLISGIGVGMLGSDALGHALLRAQLAAQLALLALPSRRDAEPPTPLPLTPDASDGPIRGAVRQILGVGGAMALFAALAGALGELAGPAVGRVALALTDVTSGARLVCALPLPVDLRLTLLAALAGYGGACVCAQNLAALAGCGVRPGVFLARRALAAALTALFCWVQTRAPRALPLNFELKMLPAAALAACLLAFPAIFRLKKTNT